MPLMVRSISRRRVATRFWACLLVILLTTVLSKWLSEAPSVGDHVKGQFCIPAVLSFLFDLWYSLIEWSMKQSRLGRHSTDEGNNMLYYGHDTVNATPGDIQYSLSQHGHKVDAIQKHRQLEMPFVFNFKTLPSFEYILTLVVGHAMMVGVIVVLRRCCPSRWEIRFNRARSFHIAGALSKHLTTVCLWIHGLNIWSHAAAGLAAAVLPVHSVQASAA